MIRGAGLINSTKRAVATEAVGRTRPAMAPFLGDATLICASARLGDPICAFSGANLGGGGEGRTLAAAPRTTTVTPTGANRVSASPRYCGFSGARLFSSVAVEQYAEGDACVDVLRNNATETICAFSGATLKKFGGPTAPNTIVRPARVFSTATSSVFSALSSPPARELLPRFCGLSGARLFSTTPGNSKRVASKLTMLMNKPNIFAESTMLANKYGAANLGQGFPSYGAPDMLATYLTQENVSDIRPNGGFAFQYSVPGGSFQLRDVVASHYSESLGYGPPAAPYGAPELKASSTTTAIPPLTRDGVLVTVGGQEAIYTALSAWTDPGDKVVALTPCYDGIFASASLQGVKMVGVETRPGDDVGQSWAWDEAELRAALEDARIFYITNPSAPTGTCYSADELNRLAAVLADYPDVLVLADEVYHHAILDGAEYTHVSSVLRDRTLSVFSAGKSFSCTGWRVGFIAGPPELVGPCRLVHTAINFCPTTPVQHALAALYADGFQNFVQTNCAVLNKKCAKLCAVLDKAGFKVHRPDAGYFVVAEVPTSLRARAGTDDDVELAKWLTMEVGVTALPLTPFYTEPPSDPSRVFLRFAFCKDDATIGLAAERLAGLATYDGEDAASDAA